ncbi:hypothetical protein OK006_9496 [Actinobacteria bacterium OK006]|nr:hypothetical protein OK006_9496 [Actinobacteria bacterium OK006]
MTSCQVLTALDSERRVENSEVTPINYAMRGVR